MAAMTAKAKCPNNLYHMTHGHSEGFRSSLAVRGVLRVFLLVPNFIERRHLKLPRSSMVLAAGQPHAGHVYALLRLPILLLRCFLPSRK